MNDGCISKKLLFNSHELHLLFWFCRNRSSSSWEMSSSERQYFFQEKWALEALVPSEFREILMKQGEWEKYSCHSKKVFLHNQLSMLEPSSLQSAKSIVNSKVQKKKVSLLVFNLTLIFETEPLQTVWGWFSPTEVAGKSSSWHGFHTCSQNRSIFKNLHVACLQHS